MDRAKQDSNVKEQEPSFIFLLWAVTTCVSSGPSGVRHQDGFDMQAMERWLCKGKKSKRKQGGPSDHSEDLKSMRGEWEERLIRKPHPAVQF